MGNGYLPIIDHRNLSETEHLGSALIPTGHPALPGGLICAIGNPLNDGTWTYSWQNGRQLARMQSVDIDASCVYNENGLRVQKTVNGIVTDYTLHGKNVAHMKMGNDELHFSSMPATNPLWWCTMVCLTAM